MTIQEINELIINQDIDWENIEEEAKVSFYMGIDELIEDGELKENKANYKIELKRMSLSFLDAELGIPNLSFEFSIILEQKIIGSYKSILDLDLKELDDYLILF